VAVLSAEKLISSEGYVVRCYLLALLSGRAHWCWDCLSGPICRAMV